MNYIKKFVDSYFNKYRPKKEDLYDFEKDFSITISRGNKNKQINKEIIKTLQETNEMIRIHDNKLNDPLYFNEENLSAVYQDMKSIFGHITYELGQIEEEMQKRV